MAANLWATWLGFLFVMSFSWIAAIKAPEFIKKNETKKPRAQLVLTIHLWISPWSGLCCTAPTQYPTNPTPPSPKAGEGAGGETGSVPQAQQGQETNVPGTAGGSARAAVGSPWAGMRSRKDRFGREQLWEEWPRHVAY